eukprot:gene5269-biopygen5193
MNLPHSRPIAPPVTSIGITIPHDRASPAEYTLNAKYDTMKNSSGAVPKGECFRNKILMTPSPGFQNRLAAALKCSGSSQGAVRYSLYTSSWSAESIGAVELSSSGGMSAHANSAGATNERERNTNATITGSIDRMSGDALIRRFMMNRLIRVNAIAETPVSSPMAAANMMSLAYMCRSETELKRIVASSINPPKLVSWRRANPSSWLAKRPYTKTPTKQQVKIIGVRLGCQWVAISSDTNSSPPIGAPKATATPHAAPAVIASRWSFGLRMTRKYLLNENCSALLRPEPMVAPMIDPMWIIGPSGPTGSPELTAQMHENVFATRVLMLNTFLKKTPFKYAMQSVTPEPPAAGHHLHISIEMAARHAPGMSHRTNASR